MLALDFARLVEGVQPQIVAVIGDNSLHGGKRGFDKVLWMVKDVSTGGVPALELNYLSKDGEEGYPGNLNVTVRYTWTDAKELKIDYAATTDKDTVLNYSTAVGPSSPFTKSRTN